MISPIERFLSKISITKSGCWEWTGYLDKDGYGTFWSRNVTLGAHRFAFEYYYGAICPDLTINHLCRNRRCVNPEHLEQITNKENVLKGVGLTAINARKTHCMRGHEFTPENTYSYSNQRICKICVSQYQKDYRQKKKSSLINNTVNK